MRLYTIEYKGQELPAVAGQDGAMYTLESLGIHVRDMNELIVRFNSLREEIGQKIDLADAGREPNAGACAPGTYRVLAPVPVPMQDVICLGVNYMSHMSDMELGLDFKEKKAAIYFAKRVNRSNDPGGRIPLYDFVDSLDYEVELGVILGRDAFCVSREEALSYVLGYTIINDEKRQSSNTAYMITTVEEAIAELSQGMTLKAGTIIATGTPGGVAMGMDPPQFLKKGDVVRCEIRGIGELVNVVG